MSPQSVLLQSDINNNLLTLEPVRRFLADVIKAPAFEKSLSDGTDVPGIIRYLVAMVYNLGYTVFTTLKKASDLQGLVQFHLYQCRSAYLVD